MRQLRRLTLLIVAALCMSTIAGCGNVLDTSCGAFVHMSAKDRLAIGEEIRGKSKAQEYVDAALPMCKLNVKQGYPDMQLKDLGP